MTKIIFAMYNPITDCVEISHNAEIHVSFNCQKCNASVRLDEPSDIAYLTRLAREEPGLYAKLASRDGGLQGYVEAEGVELERKIYPYLHYTVVFGHVNKTCLKLTALQVPSCQTFFKINFKLGMDLSPVLPVSGPFFRDIHGCQIQHFQKAVIRRKYRLAFSHFPELAVESFNGICGINQPSYCLRIFEISGQGCPVIIPGFIDFRVLGIPFIFEQF